MYMSFSKEMEILDQLLKDEGESDRIPRRTNRAEYPLSFAQERLWFIQQLDHHSAAYNIPLAIRLAGALDTEKLERCFNKVIERHEVLRATFKKENGKANQHIISAQYYPISLHDLSTLSYAERENEARSVAQKLACKPFDLSEGPLFRIQLIKLQANEHILVLIMHHIVSDGWSTGVLINELTKLYHANEEEWNEILPDLSITYSDYAAWQRKKYENGDYQKQLEYWKKIIGTESTKLALPYDFPKANAASQYGDVECFTVPLSVTKAVKHTSQKLGVSAFTILLSAYYLFLFRYCNQKEIIVGTPVANRNQFETESLIGCIANTIPLKMNVESDSTVKDFIAEVSRTTLEAYQNQDVPFEKIVDELKAERTLYQSPIFETMFTFQNQHRNLITLDRSIETQPYHLQLDASKFDLSLSIMEVDGEYDCVFEYRTELFRQDSIKRMASNFICILEGMVDEPLNTIHTLQYMDQEEQKLMSVASSLVYKKGDMIFQRFEHQVLQNPDVIAVDDGKQRLSYAELNNKSNKLARYLRRNGVNTEAKVLIQLDRSIDLIIAILGVLKAGGTYIPVDPEQPAERTKYIINDAKCEYMLTKSKYMKDNQLELDQRILYIDLHDQRWLKEEEKNLASVGMSPDQVAYMIYTSGSTGKPKGVCNTHYNVIRLFDSAEQHFDFGRDDVWTLFHSIAFDFSVWEMWGALLNGGKLMIVPHELRRNPEAFYKFMSENRVTVLNQTPSAFKVIVRLAKHTQHPLFLKYVIFGGEALDYQDLTAWFEYHGEKTKMINMYGITETTVHVTYREVKKSDVTGNQGSFIGQPLNDLTIYILNEDLLPTPIGVPGEIYVSGAGLARGYFNRPSLTAERYIPNPFKSGGQRLYRTGDIAKRTVNGDIEYLGRSDDQVKVKGHRIELGEIKATIAEDHRVEDCVVLVGSNSRNEKELAAFITFKQKEETEEQVRELRNHLIDKLPRYMYPAHIIAVDTIPMNANGKVNKEQLLTLRTESAASQGGRPQTKTEKELVAVWEKVLGRNGIGIHDNYFSLGGDSIRSVRVISELQEMGYELEVKDMFLNQTVKELAEYLEQSESRTTTYRRTKPFELISDKDRSALSEAIEDAYPLTKLQEGMLFHMEQFPNQPIYHNIDSVRLEGALNIDLFNEAVASVVENNVMLRTSFDMYSYSVPLQLVHKKAKLPVGYQDIRHLSEQEQERVIDEYVEQEKMNKFDLNKPSLLRFYIHQRTAETFQFTLTECHLIFDGWSLTSTLSEIFDLYFDLLENKRQMTESKELNVRFSDFIRLEQESINSEEQQEFWKSYLDDCQLLKFNHLTPETKHESVEIHRRIVSLPQTVKKKLKQIAADHSVTLKSMVLAAHIKALQVISGQSDVLTGLVSNGRMEVKDGEKVKGLFLNTLPLRQRVQQGTWIDFIHQTFKMEQQILPYRRYPLPEIQKTVGQSPLFETAFNYVYFHSMEHLFQSKKLKFIDFNKNSANDTHFSLMANFAVHPPHYDIQLTLAFDRNRFSEEKMDSVADIYRNILIQIASDPLINHNNRSYLADQEYKKAVYKWNETDRGYAESGLTIQQLIAKQVKRTPEHPAVVFQSEKMTYAELNQKADQVAQFLKAQGISNNAFVGVYLERSLEMMVALLGILKAGCAYVPLDTSYPEERIKYMIADAGVECILTVKHQLNNILSMSNDTPQDCYDILEILSAQEKQPSSDFEYHRGSTEDIAYMIYTSGSTGNPKGVMIPHKGIVNRLLWMQEEYQLNKEDRVLQKTPLSFDVSVWELFWPLITGASLVIAKPEGHKDSYYLAKLIKEEQITTLHFVPTMLQEFLNEKESENCTSLKRVICSGEALAPELKDRFYKALNSHLHNLYGPTEASVDVSYYACKQEDSSVWIGKPIANIQLYVLNKDLQPVGVDRIGELFISGIGLATGYANKPSLTAEKFIPNPFSKKQGMRMYSTGDLVRLLPDGNIEYIGRKDSQVKIRGVRIELKEIESAMRSHHHIKEAVVVFNKTANRNKDLLVAYVVPVERAELSITKVKKYISTRLSDYMQPDRVIFLDKMPVSPNGKIDRKSLPDPSEDRPDLDAQYVAPEKPLEKELVEVYKKVLNLERVGILDNFFELGGNSLTAVFLINHIEKLTGQKYPINLIFENPQIKDLAHEIMHRNTWAGGIENLRRKDGNQESRGMLVDIQPNGERQALFFSAPLGGILPSTVVAGIIDFSHALGKKQPFFGIQTPPLSGELSAKLNLDQPSFIEQMNVVRAWEPDQEILPKLAKESISMIREKQPSGPYVLGGFCTGSHLTLEIASQLEKEGEHVKEIIMIDSFAPGYTVNGGEQETPKEYIFDENDPVYIGQMSQSLAWFTCREIGINKVSQSVQEVAERIKCLPGMDQRWEYITDVLIASEVVPIDTTSSETYRLYVLYKLNTEATRVALNDYHPKKVNSDITLFIAKNGFEAELHQDHTLGWSQVTFGNVNVNYVSGDHLTVLTVPNVYEITDILDKRLRSK